MFHLTRLTCVLSLSAAALCAQTVPVPAAVETTGMIGIADGQTAQFNLLNPGVLAPALGVVCTATASFVDRAGNVLKTTSVTVPPGQSAAFDLRSDTDLKILVAGDRVELRAVISIPSIVPPPNASATATPAPACKLIPTLELFDTASGRTLVTLGHVESVPSVVTP